MALVLVQHDISGVVVELDEAQLAHPILGPHYKRVRVNANGKVYAWNSKDPDTDSDTEVKAVLTDAGIQSPDVQEAADSVKAFSADKNEAKK